MDYIELIFNDTINILSIDVGMNNLALYIEEVNIDEVYKIKNINMNCRYNKNGECTDDMNNLLNNLYKCGKKIWIDKVNITSETDKFIGTKRKRRIVDNNMLIRLTNYLNSNKKIFDNVNTIIIENQMKTNPNAQQLQYHIRAWFLINYYNVDTDIFTKQFICFPSKYKTQILGCYKKLPNKSGLLTKITKTQRKNWAKIIAKNILNQRQDDDTINYIFTQNKSKADDLSDCICQCYAFIYLKYLCKYNF
jgi:hypothetical protein